MPAAAGSELEQWASSLSQVVELVDLRRTSNKSRRDFLAMLERGANGRPDDPDVQQLAKYGHSIVLPEGWALRERLGAFTITRGSVDGSRSRAVLGWAIPIGRHIFVLYLESARAFDVAGRTPDQAMNAFAEALRAIIRGARPGELHTPLLSRVFRLIDHAVPCMRTLRTYQVRLYAEGRLVPLDSDDDKFLATIQAAMYDKDAAATVARLEGDRLSIYGRGEWYLGRNLLPFTWDTEWELVTDPATGAQVRREVDRHTIRVTERGPKLLQLLVRLGGTRGVGRDAIAIALGEKGVVSRAPQHVAHPVTIDKLKNPRTAVDSLITREWVQAFRTGWYETEVEFTSDLRSAYPNAPLRVEDGRHWLKIRVKMPAPPGGWGIEDDEWEAFEKEQFGTGNGKARGGRTAATKGRLRPLLGLCCYLDNGLQRTVLGFESSGYQLCERDAALATELQGRPRAWRSEASWVATVSSAAWHASLAKALLTVGLELADRLAPLTRETPPVTLDDASTRIQRRIDEINGELTRAKNRIAGIRIERQEARGDDELSEAERQEEVDRLNGEEREARKQRTDAEQRLEHAKQEKARSDAEPQQDTAPTAGDDDADFSTLELVIAALRRFRSTAPAALAHLLHTLLGDSLRWQLEHHGTRISWSAVVHLRLRDGSVATRSLAGTVPTSTGSSRRHLIKKGSERQKRLPQRVAAAPGSSADAYAKRFFLDGASLAEIATDRGTTVHGGSAGTVYRDLRDWLLEHGVASLDLVRAALDMPIPRSRRPSTAHSPATRRRCSTCSNGTSATCTATASPPPTTTCGRPAGARSGAPAPCSPNGASTASSRTSPFPAPPCAPRT